jgi:hypothetical protein
MADNGIKKVVIKESQLPAINSDQDKYVVRYRIISEDRNRVSHWSPQYFVDPTIVDIDLDDGIVVTQTGNFLTVTWDSYSNAVNYYDVFVAWGSSSGSVGLPDYYTSVVGQFVTIPIRTSETTASAKVWVQRITQPKRILDSMTVAISSVIDLD